MHFVLPDRVVEQHSNNFPGKRSAYFYQKFCGFGVRSHEAGQQTVLRFVLESLRGQHKATLAFTSDFYNGINTTDINSIYKYLT